MEPSVDNAWQPDPPAWHADPAAWQPRQKFVDRLWIHAALFLLTIVTTTDVGAGYYLGFLSGFRRVAPAISGLRLFANAFWYSGTAVAILTAHELGHYLACRYYNIDASRPYFLPIPSFPAMPTPFGTLGAFIRIREPIPLKRMLFDIGIAGPIAGFLLTVPALFIGLSLSNIVAMPDPLPQGMLMFGDSLLFKIASHLMFGSIPAGHDINAHPMVFAAWFGMMATALNLLPFGQLDGGHITYCVLGRKSWYASVATVAVTAALSFIAASWVLWTVILLVMLRLLGRHHPPVIDEDVPLDRSRMALAVFALVMFILCFIPAPLTFSQ